jgi:hypothetical protein
VNFSQLEFLKGYGEGKKKKINRTPYASVAIDPITLPESEPFLSLCKTDQGYSVGMGKCRSGQLDCG